MTTSIAILASGSGTNAQALMDASAQDRLGGGRVVVVVSDRKDAEVLERARRAGIEAVFIDPAGFPDRSSYGAGMAGALAARGVELVCLAGFMRVLAPSFIKPFEGRVLNTHPALLPSFPGAHAVADALSWGVKVTGATVHFATEEVDAGPIILQAAVEILPGEDEASLHERIKALEHLLYPEAVRLVVEGRVKVQGRLVSITEAAGRGRAW